MAITARQKYLLNNVSGYVANLVQLGTLIEDLSVMLPADIPLDDGLILVGGADDLAAGVALTGDIGITNAGVSSITAGAIVNADVNAAAAIAYSKLALTGAITNADFAEDVFKVATGTLTQANLQAIGTPVEALPAPGAGKVIVVDEVELFHSYSTAAYATGGDVALEYATSGDNITLVADTFFTAGASASNIIKPTAYNLDASTGTGAGLDVTANANKAVNFTGTNFTNGNVANVVKWKIRYHVVTLLT